MGEDMGTTGLIVEKEGRTWGRGDAEDRSRRGGCGC